MRKSYWSLLGVVAFSAIVLFSLWLDLRGIFQDSAAPRPGDEQGTEADSSRTRIPTDDLDDSHRRKTLENREPPTSSTWLNVISEPIGTRDARLAGFFEPLIRLNPVRKTVVFSEDDQPADFHAAPTRRVLIEPERLPEPSMQGDAEEPLDPNETAAIVSEIRQQLGGSVLLRTIFAEGPNGQKTIDREFIREIRRRERATVLSKNEIERSVPITTPDRTSHVEFNASRVGALRDAARELDLVADGLERLSLYKQADQLRKTAQQLRLDARQTKHDMK